jgi:hypothetical protein
MIKALIVKQVAKAVIKEARRYSFDVAMDKANNKLTLSVVRKKGN